MRWLVFVVSVPLLTCCGRPATDEASSAPATPAAVVDDFESAFSAAKREIIAATADGDKEAELLRLLDLKDRELAHAKMAAVEANKKDGSDDDVHWFAANRLARWHTARVMSRAANSQDFVRVVRAVCDRNAPERPNKFQLIQFMIDWGAADSLLHVEAVDFFVTHPRRVEELSPGAKDRLLRFAGQEAMLFVPQQARTEP
ncbi:hypothetical protein [Gemmata obscuriglobus]|uniref:hypothetical protein n=1 Tax=Gemmata obscuriglobus TaxID=114 RepID=UPI0011CDAFBF|nr:hypothetical protein [Gemmata obscuriglobus]